jgi:serine/threonine protein phosphatase 1
MKWCISDIHGCFHSLQDLLRKVSAVDPTPSFVFGGDYIDRGLHSKQVIDTLIDLSKTHNCVFLRGNHEDMFIHWLTNGTEAWDDVSPGLYQYLIPTLQSYGLTFSDQNKIPAEHVEFLLNLKAIHMEETFFAVHAFYFDVPLPREERFLNLRRDQKAQMIWGRFSSACLTEEKLWGIPGVFGHTPTCNYGSPGAPKFTKWIKLIDTGSFVSPEQGGGNLCAYCPETDGYIITPTVPEDLKDYADGRRRV